MKLGVVCSCSLATGAGLVATGGEDDTCFVWRPDTGEVGTDSRCPSISDLHTAVQVVSKLAGWGDSVTATCWNKDSSMLAAGDMAGTVRVYRDQVCVPLVFVTPSIYHPSVPRALAGRRCGATSLDRT